MDPSSPRPQLPRVFMSHSHLDDEFGLRLAADLRRILGEESAVWYDASGDLHGGDAWWRKIVSEITSRSVFLVILSPESMASSWVNDEIDLAWSQKNARGMLILPVLYQPCTIRADLTTRQVISFVPPVQYESAFRSLLVALNLPPAVITPAPITPPITPTPITPPPITPAPAAVCAPVQERTPTPSAPVAAAAPGTSVAPFALLLMSILGAFPTTRIAVDRDELSIGRDTSNDIVVADDAVSRFHLRLLRQSQAPAGPSAWHILAAPGAGNLYVNGVAVSGAPVGIGDQIVIGGTVLRLEPVDARALATGPRLVVTYEGTQFLAPVRLASVTLGRDPRSGIVVPAPVISAHHAIVSLAADGSLMVEDAGSRNGLYHQGLRVQRTSLRHGDQVLVGTSALDARSVTLTYLTQANG